MTIKKLSNEVIDNRIKGNVKLILNEKDRIARHDKAKVTFYENQKLDAEDYEESWAKTHEKMVEVCDEGVKRREDRIVELEAQRGEFE